MRRSNKTVLAAFAALAILSSVPTSAHAGDEASAEVLFREGVDHMKNNEFAKACEAFAGSNKSDPSPGTQINLAICHEKQGKLASAWTWYLSAVPLAMQKNQTERAETARKEAARLEPLLHKLVINADVKLDGLTVTRGGVAMAKESVGRAIPIDPGEHLIEVSAKGKKPWKTTITMAATAGTDTLAVPPLEDAPEDKSGTGPGGGDAGQDDGGSKRTIGLVLGGAGLAVLVGAGVVQLLAMGQDSDAQDIKDRLSGAGGGPDCLNQSTPLDTPVGGTTCGALRTEYQDEKDGATSKQTMALVLGGAGVVMVGVGATLFFTSPSKSSSSAGATTPRVSPLVSPTLAGFSLTGRF